MLAYGGQRPVNRSALGIILMLGQQISFTAETAFIHSYAASLPLPQIALLRGVGGLLLVLVLSKGQILSLLKTNQIKLQTFRAVSSVGYLGVFAYSYKNLPLTDATALSYSTAVYIVLLAAPILGERITAAKALSVVVGFVGTILIIRPGFHSYSFSYLAILAGTSLNGLAFVLTKRLNLKDSSLTTMLYINLFTIFIFLPIQIQSNDLYFGFALLPLLIFGPLGQYFGIAALRYAEAGLLAPYNYMRLVLTAALAYFAFQELPDIWSLTGASIIFASCVVALIPRKNPPAAVAVGREK